MLHFSVLIYLPFYAFVAALKKNLFIFIYSFASLPGQSWKSRIKDGRSSTSDGN
jgi:hypothetical protein